MTITSTVTVDGRVLHVSPVIRWEQWEAAPTAAQITTTVTAIPAAYTVTIPAGGYTATYTPSTRQSERSYRDQMRQLERAVANLVPLPPDHVGPIVTPTPAPAPSDAAIVAEWERVMRNHEATGNHAQARWLRVAGVQLAGANWTEYQAARSRELRRMANEARERERLRVRVDVQHEDDV